MFKKVKVIILIISLVVVMTISAIPVSASAYTPTRISPQSTSSSAWGIFIDRYNLTFSSGILSGLEYGSDWGVTFICQIYNNGGFSSFDAYAQIVDRSLCEYYNNGVILSYANDSGTDIFRRGWYDVCGGTVSYNVQARNYIGGYDQYIAGVATGPSNPYYNKFIGLLF